MIIQGSQLLWYPRSSQTTRQDSTTPASGATLNRSLEIADPSWRGSGRAAPPAALSGPGDQGWFGQFGAVSITKAPSSLIVHNTSGNILIGGNAYSLAAGQCDVCTSPFSGEWDGAKNSGQCAFSLVENRSTSVPYRVQIIRTRPEVQLTLSLRNPSSSKEYLPCGSGDWGRALLWWRESEGSMFVQSFGSYKLVQGGLGDLCKKPQTCCRYESAHATVSAAAVNPLALRKLLPAPSGLCAAGSEVLTIATKPVCPRTLVPGLELMHPSWLWHMTYLCAMASELRCCHGRPRCTNGPKFTPFKGFKSSAKTSAGVCVVNCLVWNGALKTKWRPSAPDRGERLSPPLFVKAHSQICYRLTLGENDLTHIHFHIASRTPLVMKQFVYMAGWRVPWLS